MKKIQDMNVGDMTVWIGEGFFELIKTKSYIEQQGDRQVLVVECNFSGDRIEAEKHLKSEFGYPVEIRPRN